MTEKIHLPPLPEPLCNLPKYCQDAINHYTRSVVDDYLNTQDASIKADRQKRHLKEKAQLEQEWSELKCMQAQYEADRKTAENQVSAYRVFVGSMEMRLAHLQEQHDELKKSTDPDLLASERAANAMLTEELEAYRQARGEPVAWLRNERGNYQGKAVFDPLVLLSSPTPGFFTATYSPVYTAPQPQQTSNDWKDAVDHELVIHGSTADSYASPEQAIQDLLDWHVSMAVDPELNGGFKLVPIEPTIDMINAGWADDEISLRQRWKAMVGMAPRP
jgi:hypothetical protein